MPLPVEVRNAAGTTLVTNAGSNGKFLGVLDLDVREGKVRGIKYRLLPVFSNLLPADTRHGRATSRKVRAPYAGKARREARHHRWPALPPRQLQRHR